MLTAGFHCVPLQLCSFGLSPLFSAPLNGIRRRSVSLCMNQIPSSIQAAQSSAPNDYLVCYNFAVLTLRLPGLVYPRRSGVTLGLQTHLKIAYDIVCVCVCVTNVINVLGTLQTNTDRNHGENKFYTDKRLLYCIP